MTTQYISTKNLAKRWGVSHRTLQRWRDNEQGLPYIKIGRQVVRYSLEDIKTCETASFSNLGKRNLGGLKWQAQL